MRSSTIIPIAVAVVFAVGAVVLSASYLSDEREAAVRKVAEEKPQLMVVVAVKPIAFGEKLHAKKLEEVPWYSDEVPQGLFASVDELMSDAANQDIIRHAMTSFQIGEPIHEARITKAGEVAKLSATITPGYKAVSIRVNDVLGVAGFVLPGDHVDVLLARNTNGQAFVDVLLQSVKVLAVDQQADNRADEPSVVRTVTFEVSTQEAQQLILGASVGSLSLTLRHIESTDAERNERISMDVLDRSGKPSSGVSSPKVVASKSSNKKADPIVKKAAPTAKKVKPAKKKATQQTSNTAIQAAIEKPVIQAASEEPASEPIFSLIGVTRGQGVRQEYRVISEELVNENEAVTN
jgi:pilus assembly protein CpaB